MKENGLNPFNYLKYLFEELPNIDLTDDEKLDQFLPWSTTIPLYKEINVYYIVSVKYSPPIF